MGINYKAHCNCYGNLNCNDKVQLRPISQTTKGYCSVGKVSAKRSSYSKCMQKEVHIQSVCM